MAKDKALKEYLLIKKEAEDAQQQADKAEGALEEVMKRLKDEFGCSTLEAAEKEMEKRKKEETKTNKAFKKAVDKYNEDFKNE